MVARILLAEDHHIVREAFRHWFDDQPQYEVVGEAQDGTEALSSAIRLGPDLVLLDWSMPGLPAAEVIAAIRARAPSTRVLVLTSYKDGALLEHALRAGAHGFVTKDAQGADLLTAIRTVLAGSSYVHPSMVNALVAQLQTQPQSSAVEVEALGPRELQVLRCIALGYTNQQTADALGIAPRTVERHRSTLMDKLGVRNRAALVQYARENGLID